MTGVFMRPVLLGFLLLMGVLGSAGAVDEVGSKEFDVTLQVDFGPAGKPSIRKTVHVTEGTTPEQLLAQVCTVRKGRVCCDPREVAGIDGVASHEGKKLWWMVSVNGQKKTVSPYQTRLKPNDVVLWEYRKSNG